MGGERIILDACRKTLDYAEGLDYSGYGKFDAMNSPFLKAVSLNNAFLRLVITQIIMRTPVNMRPFFGVRKEKNPKGIGLFAQAYLDLHNVYQNPDDLKKAEYCLNWLLVNSTPGYSGLCWGYNFDWQNAGLFFAPKGFPNCVTTVVCAEALLQGYFVTKKQEYLDAAKSAANFLLSDLPVLLQTSDKLCVAYVPIQSVNIVINVNALTAAFLAKLARVASNELWRDTACKLIRYVVSEQTDYHAWYYTDPPGKSYIGHDNYHTGFILDGILQTCSNADVQEFMPYYHTGLDFYIKNLFGPNGEPFYMSTRTYPYDIHGAAQGIITLSSAARFRPECLKMAEKTAFWAIEHMQHKDGSFAYQIGKFVKHDFTLMRWCNAWMVRALAHWMRERRDVLRGKASKKSAVES
ncbi:MAG: hypothetical protein JXN60_00995 [Lentisphaerae bacterium]|nr:hypothetical protein [Lentisphaerota bacterium]